MSQSSDDPRRVQETPASAAAPSAGADGEGQAGVTFDGRIPSSIMRSYALLTPEVKQKYMAFYRTTYGKGVLDARTKELVSIAAALASGCKGCLEGHMKKAKKNGATAEEIAEVVALVAGVAAASIVDRADIANFNLGDLFDMPG